MIEITRNLPLSACQTRLCGILASLLGFIAVPAALTSGCDRTEVAVRPPSTAPTEVERSGHDHKEEGHDHAHDHGHADEVKLTSEAISRNGIRVATAKRQVLDTTLSAPARVAFSADHVAHVGSAVTGRVSELKVGVGDKVKRGDALIVIDSPELGESQSDFLQKRTAVEIAVPAVELAKSAYERAKQLYDENQGISLTEVQKRQGEYQAAMGNVAATKAALTAAENRLHLLGMDQAAVETLAHTSEIDPKYVIRAPIDGQVTEREATLGELVGPDNDKLLVLANLGVVWVFADVPEAAVSNITLGAEAAITVAATGEEQFEGKIAHISPELDPSTRTARIRIEIPNPQMRLFPGMFARAEIHTGASDEPVIAIPADAIQTIEGDPSVFVPVRGEKNTFAKRQVGVGRPINGLVPVLAGLNEGDRYVVVGSFILKAELGKAGAAHEH